MARSVEIILEVDDRGTAKIRQFSRNVKKETDEASKGAQGAFARMNAHVGGSIDNLTQKFLRWGSIVGGVFGGLAARQVLKFGTDFEASMSGVRAVSTEVGASFAQLQAQARQLGATTAFTAIEAATAMEELGKAGFETGEVLKIMPDVLNLAGAGLLEMSEAAGITSDVVRSLGIDVEDFGFATDVIARTSTSAKTTVQELGFAFQDSAPVARALGQDVVGLNAGLGILANRGFTATRAGTALRRIYSVFLGDLEEGEKGLAGFNVEVFNADGSFRGLADIVEQFKEKGIGALEIMEAFGLRGGPAMLSIFRAGSEELREFEEMLREAGGAAGDVFEERFNNLRGRTREFTSALQELSLLIFDKVSPALTAGATSATEMVRAWGKAIQASDVMGGLERIATALKLAFVALSVTIGVGLVRKMQALVSQALIPLVAGFDATTVAVYRADAAIVAWNASSVAAKAGIVGMAGAVGLLGWQAGRAIAEVTGLDDILTEAFVSAGNFAKNAAEELDDVNVSLNAIDRNAGRLQAKGVQFFSIGEELGGLLQAQKALEDFDPNEFVKTRTIELEAAIKIGPGGIGAGGRFNEAQIIAKRVEQELQQVTAKIKLAADEASKSKLLGQLQDLTKKIKALSDDELGVFNEAMLEAAKAGKVGVEQLETAYSVFAKKKREDEEAQKKADERLAATQAKYKASIEELGQKLQKLGLSTKANSSELVKQFNEAKSALGSMYGEGLRFSDLLKAYAPDVLAMEEGFKRMGREVPQDLQEIADAVRAMQSDVENFNASSAFVEVFSLDDARLSVAELRNDYEGVIDLLESGSIGETEAERALDRIKQQLIELMETVPELGGLLKDVVPGFDPTPFTEGAEQAREGIQRVQAAEVELAEAELEGLRQDEPFSKERWEKEQQLVDEQAEAKHMALEEEMRTRAEAVAGNDEAMEALAQENKLRVEAIDQETTNKKIKLSEMEKEQKKKVVFGMAKDALGALETIFGSSKATAIASALINTAEGVTKTLGAYPPPFSFALAGLVAAAGAVQIAKIRSQKPAGKAQFGGLITRRSQIEVGEAGQEAIVPLTGLAARRARDAMGIRELMQERGRQPLVVRVQQNFTGDNWSSSGLSDELTNAITDAIEDAVRSGRKLAFSTGAL